MVNKMMSYYCCLTLCVLLCTSCEKEISSLNMKRANYTSSELKITGYYLSDITADSMVGIAVFFRNGVCIHFFSNIENENAQSHAEQILNDPKEISRFLSTPTYIGVFDVFNQQLHFNTWEASRDITVLEHEATIINDTTFTLDYRYDQATSTGHEYDLTYHFTDLNPKPDSTSSYID